jgi:pyridinium-3,5-bisthiocarboxylic acid mononucleotide nickel chelatase
VTASGDTAGGGATAGGGGVSRLLYIDCVGGVAGDMLLGALLDAGADADAVRGGLEGLGVEGLALTLGSADRHGIVGVRAEITAAHHQPHRHWSSIRQQIDAAGFPSRVAVRAQEAFRRLAVAEGRIHGIEPERVHFHEVGAVDAIGEVCGVALALESLGIDRVVCSPLPAGRGFVKAAHGTLPLPAPATLKLLEGAPLYGVEIAMELVTPTGAALVAALAEGYGPLPAMTLRATGYGAGARDLEAVPNVVRVIVGEATAAATAPVLLIEANLDDMVPELAPDAAAACFAAGALDVWTTPIQMKRGRPAFQLSALARPHDERAVAEAMLRETSTLGVRIARYDRIELERESWTVEVSGEPVRVKVGRLDGRIVNLSPEHADCERAARATGAAVKTVWARALAAAHEERP